MDHDPRIAPISQFIEQEIGRWEQQKIEHHPPADITDKLNALFRESLAEIWGCEHRIQELMKQAGMTRQEAEFAAAIERSEIPGDLIAVEDGHSRKK